MKKVLASLLIGLSTSALLYTAVFADDHDEKKKHSEMEMHHKDMSHDMDKHHGTGKIKEEKHEEVELSVVAKAGKELFKTCDACHSQSNDPMKAPPMFAVKKHYSDTYPNKKDFVAAIATFANAPTTEKVLLKRPMKKLGLMPPMPIGKENLTKIATYIYEEQFSKPCKHWEIMIKNAEKSGEADEHIEQDKRKYQRFCSK